MNEKLQEIFKLCLRINKETEYAAFFNYSGHVECFDIRVTESKKNYTEMVYDIFVYQSIFMDEQIDTVIKKLNEILDK